MAKQVFLLCLKSKIFFVSDAVSKSVGANETTLHKINIQIGAFLANKTSRMQEKTISGISNTECMIVFVPVMRRIL